MRCPCSGDHKKEILLFTPKQEFHELPLQFICYLLRKNRNKVSYFGCNVPLTAIEEYNKTASFSYLYFHVVTNLTGISADEYLNQISTKFPDKQIVMSGTQILQVTHVPNNVRLLHSMNEVSILLRSSICICSYNAACSCFKAGEFFEKVQGCDATKA
jgi:hypothetical protein